MIVAVVTPNPHLKIKMYSEENTTTHKTDLQNHLLHFSPPTSNHELKMNHETETRTIRLTNEIIRCIAKSLLATAEELERSLWHYSTPTEHSQSSTECDDDALKL